MRILITGASGVIGQKLVQSLSLLHPGANIDATYFTHKSGLIRMANSLPSNLNIIHYQKAFDDLHEKKYDQIWHFATYGQPVRFMNQWQDVLKLNSTDILKLSNALEPHGVFHYASTSELYGSTSLATESSIPASKPHGIRAIYTESKRTGEAICSTIFPKENHIIYRICLAYSEQFRSDDKRVLYELVMKSLNEGFIGLLDTGDAIRQYIYADDAISMMLHISASEKRLDFDSSVFNIANPETITIYQLALIIGGFTGTRVIQGKLCNPLGALPSVEVLPERYLKINSSIKFTSLTEGISRVINTAKTLL